MKKLGKRGEAPQVIVRLPAPMVTKLEKLAGRKRGAFSALIREILGEYLARSNSKGK